MTYLVPCECGKVLEVTAADAGTDVRCACGRLVNVPLLSQLRRLSGQAEYETGMIDTINRMLRNGELPPHDRCMICGLQTSDTFDVHVQCETTWVQDDDPPSGFFLALLAVLRPIRLLRLITGAASNGKGPREFGRNRGIDVPLRICTGHHEQLRRDRQETELRKLLRTIHVYNQLLEEFPSAAIAPRGIAKLKN